MSEAQVHVSPADFDFFRGWLRTRSAIVLELGKEYLVETRLEPVARAAHLADVGAVLRQLRQGGPASLELMVVEALTTNETSFFRDWKPFEALRTLLVPALLERRAAEKKLVLWSAACSSGQEAYSLAMLLADHFPQLAAWDVSIHCTDLSTEMVARTRAGRFSQLQVNRGLPAPMMVKHFRQEGNDWQASEALRARIKVAQLNLAGAWPLLPQMDLVLMRNVLIYFDVPTRKAILDRVLRVLRPGGVLLLGSAETTLGLHEGYKRIEAGGTTYFASA